MLGCRKFSRKILKAPLFSPLLGGSAVDRKFVDLLISPKTRLWVALGNFWTIFARLLIFCHASIQKNPHTSFLFVRLFLCSKVFLFSKSARKVIFKTRLKIGRNFPRSYRAISAGPTPLAPAPLRTPRFGPDLD